MWQGILVAVGMLFVLIVLAGFYASRYKKVGPNQVLVISGRRRMVTNPVTGQKEQVGFRIRKGGGAFIVPVLERVDILSMEILTIEVEVRSVYTIEGVPVHVDGVAQIKIRGDDASIYTAAEQFLSKGPDGIIYVAHETLAGHLRAILGMLTVEEIYRDRDAFAQKVLEVSGGDLANMGLEIVSFVIKDIRDDKEYLESLGRTRTAEVKRDAVKGEADAARDATIQSAMARQQGETAKFQAETKIAEAQKEYRVQKAQYDEASNRSEVLAELARTLQEKITNQEIMSQDVQIEVVAKQKQIEVQEQEVQRRVKELEATVKKPAEAERFRIETLANASKFQIETEATGEAESTRVRGVGEADATRARGLAQAEVIRAQGFAEAEAMEKKAAAWQQYNQAAIIQQLVEALPQVAAAVAQPLAQTDRIVVISTGGDGAGASKVTADVTNIIAQVPETIEALTGVNLIQALQSLPGIGEAIKKQSHAD